MFEEIFIFVWLSPILYLTMVIVGKIFHSNNKKQLIDRVKRLNEKIDLVIFQIPTVGNSKTVNEIIKSVKGYNLPYKFESWVIVEENNKIRDEYRCDRLIIVPKDFKCGALYKARALEYSRRLRIEENLKENYMILQCDDDALPSKEFIVDCMEVQADISIGSMSIRPKGTVNTIMDYERSVA